MKKLVAFTLALLCLVAFTFVLGCKKTEQKTEETPATAPAPAGEQPAQPAPAN